MIFIIGPSRSAKTPIADKVAEALDYIVISASEWVRSTFVVDKTPVTLEEKQSALESITDYSTAALKQNPNRCIDFISAKYNGMNENDSYRAFVAEGFRNPRDFLFFFNPAIDFVVFVDVDNNPLHPKEFETIGLKLIKSSVEWFIGCKMMDVDHVISFSMKDFSEVEMVIKNIIEWLGERPYCFPE